MMEQVTPATLVGCAVADALGMPFETRTADDPFLTSWDGETYLHSDYHQLAPGQWTDDTMMSRLLAQSLVEKKDFYGEDIAERYAHWYANEPHRGMGKATGQALKNLTQGTSWRVSGVLGAEGNGSAMRAAPIGVFFSWDLERATEAAKLDAYITHASVEASEGSVMIALATAYLARRRTKDGLLDWLSGYTIDCAVGRSVCDLNTCVLAGMPVQEVLHKFGTKAHVAQTVPSALAAFVMTNSYMEAVQAVIRAGGDTDTTAAIAGALAGTYYGLEGIPSPLVDKLEDKESLLALDRALFGS